MLTVYTVIRALTVMGATMALFGLLAFLIPKGK